MKMKFEAIFFKQNYHKGGGGSSLLHKVCRLLSLFFITTLIFNYIFF